MNAADFKDLHHLEIKVGEDQLIAETSYVDWVENGSAVVKEKYWIATWFVYDDAKCDHGHLHKQYKTKKNKDLIKLLEEIKDGTTRSDKVHDTKGPDGTS